MSSREDIGDDDTVSVFLDTFHDGQLLIVRDPGSCLPDPPLKVTEDRSADTLQFQREFEFSLKGIISFLAKIFTLGKAKAELEASGYVFPAEFPVSCDAPAANGDHGYDPLDSKRIIRFAQQVDADPFQGLSGFSIEYLAADNAHRRLNAIRWNLSSQNEQQKRREIGRRRK